MSTETKNYQVTFIFKDGVEPCCYSVNGRQYGKIAKQYNSRVGSIQFDTLTGRKVILKKENIYVIEAAKSVL